jgi:threonine/homoserine/homoserine lactone efflux protein
VTEGKGLSMTLTSSITLLGSMIFLALMPGPGILAVVGRTLAAGLRQGISTVAGIVAGDFVFITLALLGLAALSEFMVGLFAVVRYLDAGVVYF